MWQFGVPNAPCGVERNVNRELTKRYLFVPNAPCGVESKNYLYTLLLPQPFLMHRVELKGNRTDLRGFCMAMFLMHRVELKVLWCIY